MTAPDPEPYARSLALDLMRAHLPAIERATTAAQARQAMAADLQQAQQVYLQMSRQPDPSPLLRAVDELLAQMVVLQRPHINRLGLITDAAAPGASWGRAWPMVLVVVIVAVLAGLGLWLRSG